MVSRYFTNPKTYKGTLIEWRSDESVLYRHKDNVIEPWETVVKHKTTEDALARCLQAIGNGNWIEIYYPGPDVPENTEVAPW